MTPTDEWWEKMYSIDTKCIGTDKRNGEYRSSVEGSPSNDHYSQEGKMQGQSKYTRTE
jgi:hypothetical protein